MAVDLDAGGGDDAVVESALDRAAMEAAAVATWLVAGGKRSGGGESGAVLGLRDRAPQPDGVAGGGDAELRKI
jgi:hypothetical protein